MNMTNALVENTTRDMSKISKRQTKLNREYEQVIMQFAAGIESIIQSALNVQSRSVEVTTGRLERCVNHLKQMSHIRAAVTEQWVHSFEECVFALKVLESVIDKASPK